MTSPPQPPSDPAAAPGRGGQDAVWAWLRGLGVVRSDENRWMAGVAGGLADRFQVDPVLVRAGFVLLAVFGGLGLPLYLAAWVLLPDTGGAILAERAVRQRDRRSIVLVVVVAAIILGSVDGRGWWASLPAAAVLYWIYRSRRGTKAPTPDAVPPWSPPVVTPPAPSPYAASSPTSRPPASTTPLTAALPYGDPVASAASGAPYGMGPGRTGPVATPTASWSPPRAQRRRAGVLGLLLAVGLGVAGAAAGAQVLNGLRADGSVPDGLGPVPFTLGCALAGVGLALVLIGLLGRRAGFTGLLGVVLTAVTVAAASVPPFVFSSGTDDVKWTASQPAPAGGYVVGLGDGRLDLTGAHQGQQFDVQLGLGDLTILVPPGVRATITPTLGLGDLAVEGATNQPSPKAPFVVGDGTTLVTIRANLTAGDLDVEQVPADRPIPSGVAT